MNNDLKIPFRFVDKAAEVGTCFNENNRKCTRYLK